jgi:putative hydroxymethylpyrimidine transport system permease protein
VRSLRLLAIAAGLLVVWQAAVWLTGVPHYILPGPDRVLRALAERGDVIAANAWITFAEIVAGLAIGALVGCAGALAIAYFRPARRWLLPVIVISQAIPVFAIAPLLVLWLGYGMASKIAMAVIVIFFPVTAAFYDGLRRTDPGWIDLATVMNASRRRMLMLVRVPAALPALGSGLRVAAAVAPIGAVIGEWVGSSAGLGYLMLHANARLQVDLMFAALFVLAAFAVAIYFAVDAALRRLVPWQPETLLTED